jgi:hypothetical protein
MQKISEEKENICDIILDIKHELLKCFVDALLSLKEEDS